ncbi:hypothetical protein [Kushneria indalinina]|uniref:DUF1127 domain-containing protein n=1 Tax=Kushneria indalinina DSM 14324 TaxID=1122140 RepID=A0A3D9DW34_9GAMM|nr:hypothetical protein [Kushneria indalinina]REC94982.1 hypothetical protein C8D72_1814 [Kushneria indalinina DSM 14324]
MTKTRDELSPLKYRSGDNTPEMTRAALDRLYPDVLRQPTRPELTMPAMPPIGLMSSLKRRFLTWHERRWMRQLLTHDDQTLADLGFRRAELLRAVQSPLTMDATEVLCQLHLNESGFKRRPLE